MYQEPDSDATESNATDLDDIPRNELDNPITRISYRSLRVLAVKLGLITPKSRARYPYLLEQLQLKLENDPRQFIIYAFCLEMQKGKPGVLSFPFPVKATGTNGSKKQKCWSPQQIPLGRSSAFKRFSSKKPLK